MEEVRRLLEVEGVSEGVFGFLGVLAGGLITTWVTLYLERRREKRAVRAVARLLKEQLGVPITYAERAASERRWTLIGEDTFSTGLWDEHRMLLASVLSADKWREVADAFRQLRSMRSSYRHGTARDTEERDMEETEATLLAFAAARLKAGDAVLLRLAGKPRKRPAWLKYATK